MTAAKPRGGGAPRTRARRAYRKLRRNWRAQTRSTSRRVRRRVMRRNEPAHLLHIGKTGGTALKHALIPLRGEGRYELELHDHPTVLSDIPPGEKVFFVLRDPMDRFVSGFNSRLRQGRPRHDLWWTPDEKIAFKTFETPDSLGRALSGPDPDLRARAFTAMVSITHVKDSYWHWFRHRTYLRRRSNDLLMILWFPDLTATFPTLCERLGLPGRAELPTDAVRSHRSPEDVSRFLSKEARRNIAWWYARDYAFLELCARLPAFTGPAWTSPISGADAIFGPLAGGRSDVLDVAHDG
jgi:hypothetical protein